MGVVSHGYGELGGGGIVMVVGMPAGQSLEGWSHVRRCRSTCRVRGEDTDHTTFKVCRSG